MAKVAPWGGWGEEPVFRRHLEPPVTRHVAAFSCCISCSRLLAPKHRCTSDLDALLEASDHELRFGFVEGCVLDREDELERRWKIREYGSSPMTTTTRPGLLERVLRR
ncbi:MAG: hypothetical protein H0U82_00740 [Actinobacteria bacterium]|nr:hypothetical protein [Actinomycetota bacterium]